MFSVFILNTSYSQGGVELEMVELGDANYCNNGEYDLVFSDDFQSSNVNTNKWYLCPTMGK